MGSNCCVTFFRQSLLEMDSAEESGVVPRQSPLSNLRRKTQIVRPTLTPRHSEKALLSDLNGSAEQIAAGRLSGIVRWFRGSKDRSSVDLDTGVLGPELAATFLRHGSIKGRRNGDGLGKSLQRARRRVERRLGRFGIGKGKKKSGSTEEAPGSCKCNMNIYL